MAIENLVLDAVVSSANITGATVANLNAQDGNFAVASANNVASEVRASFPTPAGGSPTTGAGLQVITVEARKNGGTSDPTFTIELYETGGSTPLATAGPFTVTGTSTHTLSFDASLLATSDGSAVEVRVITSPAGGSPTKRASIDYGFIGWDADVSAQTNVTASGTSTTADVTQSGGSAEGQQNVTGAGDSTQADVTQSGGSASGEVNVTVAGDTTQVDVTHNPGSASAGTPVTASGSATTADVTQSGGSAEGQQNVSPAGTSTDADVTHAGGSASGTQSPTVSGDSTDADVTHSGGSASGQTDVTASGDTTQADVSQTGGSATGGSSLSVTVGGTTTTANVSHAAGSAAGNSNVDGASTTADVSQSAGSASGEQSINTGGDTTTAPVSHVEGSATIAQDTTVGGDSTIAFAGSRQVQSVDISGPTNAAIAAMITDALTRWNDQLDQLADWLTGSPTGGPNSDGKYPLTNAEGESELFESLPFILDRVNGPSAAAEVAQAAAEAAETLSGQHKTAAELAQTQAELARDSAQTLRNETESFRQDVAAYWAAVDTWQQQVSTDAAQVAADAAQVALDKTDAETAATEAAASAAAAATFDPINFYTKVEADGAFKPIGYVPAWNEITSKPTTFAPSAHTHLWADITDKPTTFAPSAHGHAISDVTGLQTALDGKQAAGSYSLTGHSHVIGDVTGLQTALDGKQPVGSYSVTGHGHSISDITGLQAELDGKLDTAGGAVMGNLVIGKNGTTRGYLQVSIGSATNTGYLGFYNAAGVRQAYMGYGLTDGEVNMWSDNGAGFNFRNGPLKYNSAEVSVVGHGHSISDITGLQTALDGKLSLAGGVITGDLDLHGKTRVVADGHTGGGFHISRNTAFENNDDDVYFQVFDDGLYITVDNDNDGDSGTFRVRYVSGGSLNDLLYATPAGTFSFKGQNVFRDDYHPNADKLTTARTISLAGDVTGSTSFDGSGNVTITASVADDSHNHVIANVDGLQAELDKRPPLSNTYSTNAASAGWYTIANASTARAYGEFLVYDTASGQHHFVKFAASASYGKNNISVIHGNRYVTAISGIDKLRILYNSADRVYGGAKLQVYLSAPTNPFYMREMFTDISGWANWTPQTPTLENAPSGWTEDSTTLIEDVCSYDHAYKGNLLGTASAALALAAPRTINGVAFDGTANITVADSTKLPLTGGTLTGGLSLPNHTLTSYALDVGSGGIKRGATLEGGGDGTKYFWQLTNNGTDQNWKKVCDVVMSSGSYRACTLLLEVNEQISNYGHSSNTYTSYYTAVFNRSGATDANPDEAYLRGHAPNAAELRIVKTATGVYELQARLTQNYRGMNIEAVCLNEGGSTITFASTKVNGSTTGTVYNAVWDGGSTGPMFAWNRGRFKHLEIDGTDVLTSLGSKAPTASPTFTGELTSPVVTTPDARIGNGAGSLRFSGGSNRSWIAPRNAADTAWEFTKEFGFDHTVDKWYFDSSLQLNSGTLQFSTFSTRDKIRLYPSTNYVIGMQSAFTFGGLNDWAMTFQMNSEADRGFWWGDAAHGQNQGAMALTTEGKLTVANSIRVGYGESDTTAPDGVTYDLDVSGKAKIDGGCAISHGGSYSSGKITVSTAAPSGGADGDIWLQV